jgi:hypothetical protein
MSEGKDRQSPLRPGRTLSAVLFISKGRGKNKNFFPFDKIYKFAI